MVFQQKKINVAKLFHKATTVRGILIVLQQTKFATKLALNFIQKVEIWMAKKYVFT